MRPFAIALLLALLALLAGCATSAPAPEPRAMTLAATPDATLREAIALLMERGYVIRHADAELGRAEGVLARWPGYRVQVKATSDAAGTWVSLTATRGEQPLPPYLLDPLLAALQRRLGEP